MDHPQPGAHPPLSVEEAKARLLAAAEAADPGTWVRRHPTGILAAALVAGVLASRLPVTRLAPRLLLLLGKPWVLQTLLPYLRRPPS